MQAVHHPGGSCLSWCSGPTCTEEFTFGLLLIGACALEALLVADKAQRRPLARQWITFGLLALLAACVTPYGVESILVTQRILGLGDALSLIAEWQPQDFTRFGAFELCLLGAIGFALHRGFTLPPVRILIVLEPAAYRLAHVRNAENSLRCFVAVVHRKAAARSALPGLARFS